MNGDQSGYFFGQSQHLHLRAHGYFTEDNSSAEQLQDEPFP